MIIQVRGTSGSGKSTVVREVMERYGKSFLANYRAGRRKPLSYGSSDSRLLVLGHYESPCGGCDTIGSAAQVYRELVDHRHSRYPFILCEGLLLSEDTKWSLQLDDLRVVFLTTELETCLERIVERRKGVGNDKPLNPDNTANRVGVIERARVKLTEAGVYCRRAPSEQAPSIILNWLSATRESGRSK